MQTFRRRVFFELKLVGVRMKISRLYIKGKEKQDKN